MMLALFALGHHEPLSAVQNSLQPPEKLLAWKVRCGPTEQTQVRSQCVLMAGIPSHSSPVSAMSLFDFQCFRVLFLRCLWCPVLPLGHLTGGHHAAACATSDNRRLEVVFDGLLPFHGAQPALTELRGDRAF